MVDILLLDEVLKTQVEVNLQRFVRRSQDLGERRGAAVAVVLVGDQSNQACFLITRRASHLRRHAGQWALPGGRIDSGETTVQTALRELAEEVGLQLTTGHVLGVLDDYPTRSGYVITPVVIWGGQYVALTLEPNEVAAAYRVPLTDLNHPDIPRLQTIPQSDRPVLSMPLQRALGTEVFAPTAAILYQLREVALHGKATRVADYEQPLFAWQ